MDEVFPADFIQVRDCLRQLPPNKNIVAVGRHYLLGTHAAFPYRRKPLFFRRDSGWSYGRIDPRQGNSAAPLLFDDLVDTKRSFEGQPLTRAKEQQILSRDEAEKRLLEGDIPLGYRDNSAEEIHVLDKAFYNADVNYFPDELIVEQKWLSIQGYQNLPEPYSAKHDQRRDQILNNHAQKIKRMLSSRFPQLAYRTTTPESIKCFADQHSDLDNIVRRIVEQDHGLMWSRISDGRSLQKKAIGSARLTAQSCARSALRSISCMVPPLGRREL